MRRTNRLLLASISLAVLFGPSLFRHGQYAADSWVLNDDARHWVTPFFRYAQPALFPGDLIVDFHQSLVPPVHRAVYFAASRFLDPAPFSDVLTYALYAVLLVTIGWTAFRLGGLACAWSSLALTLSSYLFLHQMNGGTARTWAYPLLALGAAALVQGGIRWLAVLAAFAVLVYPPAALVLSAAYLLAAARAWARRQYRPSQALWPLVLILLCGGLLAASTGHRRYGPRLGPADVAEYPELGPEGRYGHDDRPPYLDPFSGVADAFGRSLLGGDPAWIPAVRDAVVSGSSYGKPSIALIVVAGFFGLVTLGGSLLRARDDPAVRRLLLLLIASGVSHLLAAAAAPWLYHPHRAVIYSVPVLAVILLPLSVKRLCVRWGDRAAGTGAVATTLVLLALLGGRGGDRTGWTVSIATNRGLYKAVAELPTDSLVAGWPEGALDNIPFVCRRSVLLNRESHELFYRDYADEMRRRMDALLPVYFRLDTQAVARLQREYGVTHLLLEKDLFGDGPPRYFEPFNRAIAAAHAGRAQDPGRSARSVGDVVYEDADFILLRLSGRGRPAQRGISSRAR